MNQIIKRSANFVATSALIFGIGAATMFALPAFGEDIPSERNNPQNTLQPCSFNHGDLSDHFSDKNDELK